MALASALRARGTAEVLLVHDRRPGDPPLDDAALADPRVRRVESDQPGVSAARNAGMDLARGRFLAFLDDDDLWMPDHLERARSTATRHPSAVLLGCDARLFHDDSPDGSLEPPEDLDRLARHRPGLPAGEVSLSQLLLDTPFMTPSVVLVRDHLRPGDRFDTGLAQMEDYDLWLRLARDRRLVFDPQPSVLVRRHRRGASRNRRGMAESSIKVLERFQDQGLSENTGVRHQLRSRTGRLWHDLAYACLVEDDLRGARDALRQSVSRLPFLMKNYVYWVASLSPERARRLLFTRGRNRSMDRDPDLRG
jgi:glycosyltransferase involved in cell wall biosynthesis